MQAYNKRSPTLGYVQGWNFIVARLLDVMSEEESFWCFAQIIESLMPLDYYSNLLGVMVDIKVFKALMKDNLPKLTSHLSKYFEVDLLLTKWLIYLFVNHLPMDAELAIWDLIMIRGVSVVFRVALTLFQLMQQDILAKNDQGEIFMVIEEYK